jgi:hypothetical protein
MEVPVVAPESVPLDPATLGAVTLDVSTLTLGEAAAAELASGVPIEKMARSRAMLRMLAIFVHVYRTSGEPPSWSELSNLRLLDVRSSTSPSPPGGTSEAARTSPSGISTT